MFERSKKQNVTKLDAHYDTIGHGYAARRKEDPGLLQKILAALGGAKTIVNIGAGAGSYEPVDRLVFAVEPSEVMIRQRPPNSLPAVRASADSLPFFDCAVDAAMAILSLHHWEPNQEAGVREMKRVARDRVVIATIDPRVSRQMWLLADYLPDVAALDDKIFPAPETICEWLECKTNIEVLPIGRDTPDWMLLSFWAHPERVFDSSARAATSGFARQANDVVQRVVSDVRRDLENGMWDKRWGHLRGLDECDVGLRLITGWFN